MRPRTPCRSPAGNDTPSGLCPSPPLPTVDGDGAGQADRCIVLGLAHVRRDWRRGCRSRGRPCCRPPWRPTYQCSSSRRHPPGRARGRRWCRLPSSRPGDRPPDLTAVLAHSGRDRRDRALAQPLAVREVDPRHPGGRGERHPLGPGHHSFGELVLVAANWTIERPSGGLVGERGEQGRGFRESGLQAEERRLPLGGGSSRAALSGPLRVRVGRASPSASACVSGRRAGRSGRWRTPPRCPACGDRPGR